MKLLSFPDLKPAKGYNKSRTQAWRDEKAGLIPKSFYMGGRKYWLDSEWDDRIKQLVAQRDRKPTSEVA